MEEKRLKPVSIDLASLFTDTITSSLKNIASILTAIILWLVTIWIPFINVGTTIAIFCGLPLELSRGNVFNPVSIFDAKYRKFLGEYFALVGLSLISIIPALLFMVVPAIIISVGWTFAFILLIDKGLDPSRCLSESTKYTYNYKWLIFLGLLVLEIVAYILFVIVCFTLGRIPYVGLLFIIACYIFVVGLSIAFQGQLYRRLVLEREVETQDENSEEIKVENRVE